MKYLPQQHRKDSWTVLIHRHLLRCRRALVSLICLQQETWRPPPGCSRFQMCDSWAHTSDSPKRYLASLYVLSPQIFYRCSKPQDHTMLSWSGDVSIWQTNPCRQFLPSKSEAKIIECLNTLSYYVLLQMKIHNWLTCIQLSRMLIKLWWSKYHNSRETN